MLSSPASAAIESIERNPQYKTSDAELKAKQQAAAAEVKAREPEIDRLKKELAEAERVFDRVSREARNARAFRDKAQAAG